MKYLNETEKRAVSQLKKEIEKRFNLIEYVLYGSKARGVHSEDSDIDVMVVLDKRTPVKEAEIHDIVFEVNLEHDTFISVLIFDDEELKNSPMSESPIVKAIRREGIAA